MNHVKHMLWTTVPAYLITFIIYLVLGFQHGANVDMSVIDETMTAFSDIFNLGIIPCFLPFWFWFCCWPVSRPSSPFFWVQFWAPSLRLSIRALTLPRFCPFMERIQRGQWR